MPRRKKPAPIVKELETLSEWMIEGFKTYGPVESYYYKPEENLACPMGAACLAKKPEMKYMTHLDPWTWADAAAEVFPELSKQIWITPTTCPEFFRDPDTRRIDRSLEGRSVLLRHLIASLNDTQRLDRNKVAQIVSELGF